MAGERVQRQQDVPNDVGEWGEKDVSDSYHGPLTIAGEQVDVEKLPAFGDGPRPPAKAPLRSA